MGAALACLTDEKGGALREDTLLVYHPAAVDSRQTVTLPCV
jgi:hypothetical protein